MDPKGAKELARVLVERNGSLPEPTPAPPLATADAAPLFHWLGIEPPPAGSPADPEAD